MTLLTDTITHQDSGFEVRKATTVEDRVGRLDVLTRRYKAVNYLEEIETVRIDNFCVECVFHPGGFDLLTKELTARGLLESYLSHGVLIRFGNREFYIDEYESQSECFVVQATDSLEYVGSCRLIRANDPYPLPTATEVKIEEEYRDKVDHAPAELSQLAITVPNHLFAPMLLRAAVQYSIVNEIPYWIATTDNLVIRLLNGMKYHFNLSKIGPAVEYLGSKSTPIYIDYLKSLSNAMEIESSKPIAQYILGEIHSLPVIAH